MHRKFFRSFLLLAAALATVMPSHFAWSLSDSEFSVQPSPEHLDAIVAGTVIDATNVEDYADVLSPAMGELISAGATTIEIGPHIDFPIHPNYQAATEQHEGSVTLGPEIGDLENYVAGRPFPIALGTDDPRAGEKAAWNMRYGYGPDETETLLMTWRYKDMAKDVEERRIEMYGALMRFDHRHTREPRPALDSNPSELYSGLYLKVNFPYDIRNTQLLTHTKLDDGAPEQAWIYLNTQRRVKRLSTGQKTDAFLGSDIMIEDFLGYNGRIRDMEWTYEGSEDRLLPMYAYDDLQPERRIVLDKHPVIAFEGAGECFPSVTWQLRRVHKLRATPRDPSHPIGYRLFTVDAATYAPVMTEIHDRGGKLWKVGMVALSDSSRRSGPNEDWQGAITDGVSMVDVQAQHCTTLQFRTRIPESGLRSQLFTTQQMRSAGR